MYSTQSQLTIMMHIKVFLLFILLCTKVSAQQDYEQAWGAYAAGRYEEALTAIEQCITGDTANYQYFFLKGRTLENLYRYDEAIVTQKRTLRLNPYSVEAQSALAALYLLSGQPVISAQLYEQLATVEPQVIRWKMSWATALQASGKPADALKQLKIVEQIDSTNWLVYKNMGDCYSRIGNMKQTAASYRKSLDLYPYNKNLYGQLTNMLVLFGREDEAITTGRDAIAIDSTNVEAWKNVGVAWYRKGIADSALFYIKKTLALGDTSLTTCRHYGLLAYHLNEYHEAEKYLTKAFAADSSNMNTMLYLASTYGRTNKDAKGLEVLDKLDKMIAEINNEGIKSRIQRGYLFSGSDRYTDAAKVFISIANTSPDNYYIFL